MPCVWTLKIDIAVKRKQSRITSSSSYLGHGNFITRLLTRNFVANSIITVRETSRVLFLKSIPTLPRARCTFHKNCKLLPPQTSQTSAGREERKRKRGLGKSSSFLSPCQILKQNGCEERHFR